VPVPEKATSLKKNDPNAIAIAGDLPYKTQNRSIMSIEVYREGLKPYLPTGTETHVAQWLMDLRLQLVLYSHRKTKYGDFRPAQNGKPARVSVNTSLNPFSFLVTLVHEIAHAAVHQQYGRKVKPHGKEWKEEYRNRLLIFLSQRVFPISLEAAIAQHLKNPKATVTADIQLERALRTFDTGGESIVYLDDLKEGDRFALSDGRTFIKGKKRRTRHLCVDLKSKRSYLISGLAEVEKLL
jgi:SprT protein